MIDVEHLSKAFGSHLVLDDITEHIDQGEKVVIIGPSGSGKSTFLRCLNLLENPTKGKIIFEGTVVNDRKTDINAVRRQMGMVFQHFNLFPNMTIRRNITLAPVQTKLMSQEEADKTAMALLDRVGLKDRAESYPAQLSGGQKRKVALAKVLAQDFDVLLLDEPTNHLDSAMIRWLEDYLKNFRGTILMVTHDRYFLDQVTNKILEISQGKIYSYESNYSGFLELKAAREEMELATERKRQSVLRMELEWAKRGCRARTTKQRARLERLEALKNGTAPEQAQVVEMDSIETRMGKKTIELQHLSKRYGDKVILDDYSYIFLRNQKVGIIGPNGCGKSTLMKMLVGQVEPDSGVIEIGETIRMGYFAQDEKEMDDRQRVIDYVKDIGEYIITRDGRISASQMLERFLFTPEMQYAPIGKLSGGEKRRLYLLGVLCQNINVLLLDEASNNLDIPTMTILEDYLNSFVGIVVAVSHDRYFLDNVADRILEFDGQGHIRQYEGGYTDYLEAHEKRFGTAPDMSLTNKTKADSGEKKNSSKDWKQNRPVKLKFTFSEQKEFDTIDDDIAALEAKIEQIDADMMKFATDSGKLNDLMKEKDAVEAALEEKMERWVYLNDLAERIEAQKQGGK